MQRHNAVGSAGRGEGSKPKGEGELGEPGERDPVCSAFSSLLVAMLSRSVRTPPVSFKPYGFHVFSVLYKKRSVINADA